MNEGGGEQEDYKRNGYFAVFAQKIQVPHSSNLVVIPASIIRMGRANSNFRRVVLLCGVKVFPKNN